MWTRRTRLRQLLGRDLGQDHAEPRATLLKTETSAAIASTATQIGCNHTMRQASGYKTVTYSQVRKMSAWEHPRFALQDKRNAVNHERQNIPHGNNTEFG